MNDGSENYNSCCIDHRAESKGPRLSLGHRGSFEKQHSPPVNLLGSCTNMPTTCLERRSRTAQSNHTQGYVAHLRKNYHRLLHGNWNALTLTGKELKSVEKAKKYHLDIVGVSSNKKRGSGIVVLDGG